MLTCTYPLRLWSKAGTHPLSQMSVASRIMVFLTEKGTLASHNWWYREEDTSRAMERYRTMRAYSAGGVVFRLTPMRSPENNFIIDSFDLGPDTSGSDEIVTMEVVLVGRSHVGIWALPKGTPQPGETIEQVAVREVREETGLDVRLIAYVGSISYSFVRDSVRYHKQVRHFLLEAIGGDTALHDHEYDLVEWFPLHEACRRLTFQNEVHILYQAEEMLQRWLQHQRKEGQK